MSVLLGLPPAYVDVAIEISVGEKLRILRREVDPIDDVALIRLADGEFQRDGAPLAIDDRGGTDLTDDIAALVEACEQGSNPRVMFLEAIGRRLTDYERGR
ncbi:hypothetical protein [Sphingobium indicum]|uniref:Uncharacterized protein n=1 Tax=Sphingobium indicum (strain DSM 16412 / CCM 7286 / MTCC 6364 / B90A) TaxID=861109 RepID=A0A1L5BKF2_SPHIB|nr:hypothetical protein [Sphingobium indicum]APL93391.1 hypothetical protein SIDU_02000 [Sphingobium indicum B90A]